MIYLYLCLFVNIITMHRRWLLVLATYLIFLNLSLMAQKLLPVRLEVAGDIDVETYHVEPVGKNGVLVFYESTETTEKGKRVWYFALLDKILKQQWLKSVPLQNKLEFKASVQNTQKVYFLFKNREKVSKDYDVYEIVVYDKTEQHFTSISGSIPYKSKIIGFEIIGNTACVGLEMNKQKADVAFIDLTSGEITPVHLDKEDEVLIEMVHADQPSERFYVIAKYFNPVTFFTDYLYVFGQNGKTITTLKVDYPDNLRIPRNFKFAAITNNQINMVGTYDLLAGRKPSWTDLVGETDYDSKALAAGFFYLDFKDGKQDRFAFYDFMKFDNTYYSVHGKEIRTSKSKNNIGKNINVFYKISNPQITKLKESTVFSVELYKPYFKTESRMDYDFYGRPYPITYEVFDGYEYYDVIFSGFDKNGNMVWNNDFPINDLKTYSLKNHVIAVPDNNFITFAYVHNGKIISQTFNGATDLGDREKTPLATAFKKDRIVQDENNRLKHWYDDYYLVYGYQKLKNRSLQDKSSRTVFYINKIVFK